MAQYESTKTGAQIDAAVENSGKVIIENVDADGYFLLTKTKTDIESPGKVNAIAQNGEYLKGEMYYTKSTNKISFDGNNKGNNDYISPKFQLSGPGQNIMLSEAGINYSSQNGTSLKIGYCNTDNTSTLGADYIELVNQSKSMKLSSSDITFKCPGPSIATVTLTGGWNSSYNAKEIKSSGDIRATGAAYATAFNQTSDERLKTITEKDVTLDVKDIAEAPIVKFYFKEDDKKIAKIGTLAQYWDKIIPEAITKEGKEGYMSMQYDVAALASVVSMAKKIIEQEERINTLEEEIKKLKNA